jgi:hypothetical protein
MLQSKLKEFIGVRSSIVSVTDGFLHIIEILLERTRQHTGCSKFKAFFAEMLKVAS